MKTGLKRIFKCLSIILISLAISANGAIAQLQARNHEPLMRDEGMERMAEILGALHYLDNLCSSATDKWRTFMDRLVLTETSSPQHRQRLIAAFNRTYRAFAEHHHQCTTAAHEAMKLYRQEGMTLSQDLVSRYGD